MDTTAVPYVIGMVVIGLGLSFGMFYGFGLIFGKGKTWKDRFHGLIFSLLSGAFLGGACFVLFTKGVCHF